MNRIGMDELEKVIDQELSDYIKETTSAMREVVEEVTDSAVDTLKISSPRKLVSMHEVGKASQQVTVLQA